MATTLIADSHFERIKNQKALAYTAGITAALLLIFFLVPLFSHEPKIEQVPPEVIEINLGVGDEGFGTDQPQIPGEPAPEASASYSPPQPVTSNEEASRDIEDNDPEPSAPAVLKPSTTRPDATRINTETKTRPSTSTNTQPVTQEAPRPKVVMGAIRGGNGSGGNGATTYERGGNEGTAGGNGDQGRVGGDPNGRNYSGQPRNLGVKIISMPPVTYQDDFKESGKVMMDVLVNEQGKLVSASYQPAGSTISNQAQINIARRWLSQTNWPKMDGGFRQRVQVTMTVNN